MLVNSVPKSSNFIGGNDVNANLGVRGKLYKGAIGPFGIDNRNTKGRRLLSVLSQNRLRVKKTTLINLPLSSGDNLMPQDILT